MRRSWTISTTRAMSASSRTPTGVGEVGNPKCGDIMKIYLKIENDVITDIKFETFGCGSAIASSSIATEMVKGRTVAQALQLTNKEVVDALGGLPAYKLHCSVLAEQAIQAAVKDYFDSPRHLLRRGEV